MRQPVDGNLWTASGESVAQFNALPLPLLMNVSSNQITILVLPATMFQNPLQPLLKEPPWFP